jgi:manganese-dependent inorganic pyrophosphatase
VMDKGTEMLVAGDVGAVARSFGVEQADGVIELPGVMSRKKEVAPKLMTAL